MALVADKAIQIYYSSTCSPLGTPLVVGVDVLS